MPTKNDTYAALVRLGIQRGYDVIPEFRLRYLDRVKVIDLVWAQRNTASATWDIVAAIEIEGCDVALSRLDQHALDARQADLPFFLALYTEAKDRNDWAPFNPIGKVRERERSHGRCFPVFSLDSPSHWKTLLPQ